jgi:poly(A) polymerase Pap1
MVALGLSTVKKAGCHEDVFVETLNFQMVNCSMFKVACQCGCHTILKSWVKRIPRSKGSKEQLIQEANAQIFAFGSY